MSKIILEPGNPNDFSDEGLDELAVELYGASGKHTEIKRREERGYGVSLHEVLYVWIPWAGLEGAVAGQVVRLVVDWAKSRWKRDRDAHPEDDIRPRSVVIWGPDDKPLMSVVVDSDGNEPIVTEGSVDDVPSRSRPA